MERRSFLKTVPQALLFSYAAMAEDAFPPEPAIPEPHFPNRLYLYVWRNWELANLDRMAQVVHAQPAQLSELAMEMGLPPKRQFSDDYRKRIYITLIRQNWHVLPEEQIVQLLDWNTSHFEFTLKEDDFLDVKLGRKKPKCEILRYQAPDAAERKKAAMVKAALERLAPGGIKSLGRRRFEFVEDFSKVEPGPGWHVVPPRGNRALDAAARRFGQGSESRAKVEIVLDKSAKPNSGDFTITPLRGGGALIHAGSERAAIRALYQLRNEAHWPTGQIVAKEKWSPLFLYSYFALYGDPLMEGDAAGLPDGYLDRVASNGMNGIWIQGVLNTLAPSKSFPEFGKGWETRIQNLRALVERAAQFGLRVYLYLNEPRAMPAEFFKNRTGIRGSSYQNVYAMCTSAPEVRTWLRESVSHVFRETPDLGGIFTITMSENHTNCFSHGGAWGDRNPVAKDCPRCSKRTGADTIAEFVQTLRDGVREHSATAEVMSYDWGWGTPLMQALIPKLPKDSSVISISEWSQPVVRGGVKTTVGEYSMSVVGPGPRASLSWKLARENGLKAVAKTQFNNTWEISAVPYIPVLPLVLDHCANLTKAGISAVMASWTCGGYPASNLRASASYAFEQEHSRQQILQTEAKRIYGENAANQAVQAWEIFSEAFQSFPYGVAIYTLPVQHGPANPLRLHPTGLAPGMMLFPYDNYQAWKGQYPPEIVQQLMSKMASRWADGLALLEKVNVAERPEAKLELAIARTCYTHFESTANQLEFYLLRDEAPSATPARVTAIRTRLIAIAERERELARKQYEVAQGESRIGYEASNQYYYTPIDLLEKVLNCDQVIAELRTGTAIGVKKDQA